MTHLYDGDPQEQIVGATVFFVGDTIEFKSKWLKRIYQGKISFLNGDQAQVFIGKNNKGQLTYELVDLGMARKLGDFPNSEISP
jgi:hypothetical protein